VPTRRATERSQLDSVLPEYEILGELGRGAMGVVLSARHRSLGRQVAIKELPAAFAADERVRDRFLREARTVASLSHPHVVVVYDFVDRDGHLALIMEQLSGGTVWDRFTTVGVTAPTACALLLSTAAGLDHAHRNGVMHRDIKPENLLFAADGQLKVTDFGMAKVVGGEKTLATADGVVLGTPAYMAPEQAEGRPVGPQADVYACGVMLYELLCGELPFNAPTAVAALIARVKDDAPPLAERAPSVPSPIARVTEIALARSEIDRYLAVEDFAVALGQAAVASWGEDWLSATGVPVTGSETIERASRTTLRPGRGSILPADDERRGVARSTVLDAPIPAPAPGAIRPGDHDAVRQSSILEQPSVQSGQRRHRSPVDLSQLSPDDVVDITEVRRSPSPVLRWLWALVFAGAFAGLAVTAPWQLDTDPFAPHGLVIDDTPVAGGQPVGVDLGRELIVTGLGDEGEARFRFSMLDVPLGEVGAEVSNGQARLEPAWLRWTTGGVVDLDVTFDPAGAATGDVGATSAAGEVTGTTGGSAGTGGSGRASGDGVGGVEVSRILVAPSHSWWQSAPAATVSLVGLFGLALIQSNVRGLGVTRRRVGPRFGLVVSGGLVGGSVFVLALMARSQPVSGGLVAAAALLGGLAVLAYGSGVYRWRRRRFLEGRSGFGPI
jgi:serine/threonine-protein kinase